MFFIFGRLFGFILFSVFRLCFLVLSAIFRALVPMNRSEDSGNAVLLYVVDGDTVKVRLGGKEESVRLLGIDAPESRENEKLYRQSRLLGISPSRTLELGKMSSAALKSIVKSGERLSLEFDEYRRDKFGRLLAYVWKGDVLVNEKMVILGHAAPCFFGRNRKYEKRIRRAYSAATMRKAA